MLTGAQVYLLRHGLHHSPSSPGQVNISAGPSQEGLPVSPRSRASVGPHLSSPAPVPLSSWSKPGLRAQGSEGFV